MKSYFLIAKLLFNSKVTIILSFMQHTRYSYTWVRVRQGLTPSVGGIDVQLYSFLRSDWLKLYVYYRCIVAQLSYLWLVQPLISESTCVCAQHFASRTQMPEELKLYSRGKTIKERHLRSLSVSFQRFTVIIIQHNGLDL